MAELKAPMVGKVIEILVKPGDVIEKGQEIVVLESMKMEIPVEAGSAGTVREVCCKLDEAVSENAVLVVYE